MDDLQQRALVWGDVELRLAPDAAAGLPWHVGQVTLEDASRSAEQIAELIDGLDEPQRELLNRLLEGSPVGRTRDAAPGAPADRPVPQLLSIGLLRRIDADTVILPRHVGQVLRGEEPGPVRLGAPDPVGSSTTPGDAAGLPYRRRRCRVWGPGGGVVVGAGMARKPKAAGGRGGRGWLHHCPGP